MTDPESDVQIRRASDRFVEREVGRLTHHGFAFGQVYDPARLSFGPMVCHDDHVLGRGVGFDDHPHEGLEIITWVVSGEVVHNDDTGSTARLRAGECGVLSTGDGVRHSEVAGPDGPARFVQVWLRPDSADSPDAPRHSQALVAAEPGQGPVRVVGEGGPLTVGVAGAALDVVRLAAGETATVPASGRVHLFVVTGALLRFSLAEPLAAGDAMCLSGAAAATTYEVTAAVPTELLIWTFAA